MQMKKLLIYGNGAMARVLYSFVRHTREVCAFTVDGHCMDGCDTFCGLPLLPFAGVETVFSPASHQIIIAVGFVEMNNLRARKYEEARAKGYTFASYVHPSVVWHDDVDIDENCIILDHVSIHPGCSVGRGAFISSNVNIGHDCDIGAGCWINAGVAIAGGCSLGERCFMGVNSSVGQGVKLGAQTFVAANTFIARDTQADEVYLSEPGQLFRMRSPSFLKFSKLCD